MSASAILAVQAFGVGSAGGIYLVLLYPILAFFLLIDSPR